MLGRQRPAGSNGDEDHEVRDIHELTSPSVRARRAGAEAWEDGSRRSPSLSVGSEAVSEQLASMSREFNALVAAGSTMQLGADGDAGAASSEGGINNGGSNLGRIGEEEPPEETNPLAIVPDGGRPLPAAPGDGGAASEELSLQRVKKEEVGSKILAWQTAKVAKINNRLKREDVIIKGWEDEQVEKATACFKKLERKMEEKRARAVEKMQNEVARARASAAEKRASAEAKRGTKVAKIMEVANLMRAVGRGPPSKRSFF